MAGIPHRAARSVRIWIFRWIQHILRAIGRSMALLVYKAFRTSRSFVGPMVQPTLRKFRFLKPYIGPLIPVILKIIQIAGYVIERLSAMLASDVKPRGLENLGNTCYFNSVMQPLCYTHSLKESLRESQTSGELTESLRNFYTDMLSGESGPFSPYAQHQIFGRESSRFDNRRQHDSHECLRHFLDNIRKEEKGLLEKASSGSSKNMLTVVDRVFGGHLMTVYVCMTCQGPYHVCEPCLDISLPICFERRKEGHKQGLNKTGKDVQMTEEDNGLEMSEDETSVDSELEQTNEEDGDENNENTKKARLKEEKDEEEEEEDVEEEEEEEEKAEDKAEAKRREEEDQTEKKVTKLEDEEVDSHEGMEEEKERKQHREGESNEREAREKEKEEDKDQDKEYSSMEEGGEKADKHQNEAKLKEEQRMKEENTEEKEKDDSLKHRTINISEKIPDEEEKHVKEEKHEKEKLEDNEHIRYKEENKDRRCKKNRRKELGKQVAVKDQSSSTLVENDCEVQQHSVEFKLRPQQKLNLKLNIRKDKASTEPEVRASVISQERSEGRTFNASDDEEQSRENDPYKNAIRLLMKPLSTGSNPQLSSIDGSPKSVEDCLMHFTRREHIHKEYLCKPCRHLANGGEDVLLTSATKQTMIFNPPAILTLHLKRFELKPGGSVKRKDMITYGELLDIAPYCSSMCLRNDPPCQNIWYSLYAVVVHSGSLESGHYTSYVKVQRNEQLGTKRFLQMEYFDRDVTKEGLIEMALNKQRTTPAASSTDAAWYCANDSSISESSLSEVLNQEAYLLFYERLN